MKRFLVIIVVARLAGGAGATDDVRLDLSGGRGALTVRATCEAGIHRLLWQTAESLEGPWRVTATGTVVDGQGHFDWRPEGPVGFVRAEPQATPGFLERLSRIRDRVQHTWPDAALLEAHLLVSGWVESYPDAVPVRGIFSVEGGTVTGIEKAPGDEVSLSVVPFPWLGSQVLAWPIAMELDVAESRLREAGFGPSYRALTLRQPVYPGRVEPYWIFNTEAGFVFVGTRTGSVSLEE
jgi:hypothetical protein